MGLALPYMGLMKKLLLTLLTFFFAAPAIALELALPVVCTVGRDCWVQQYVDQDAGSGATDYACGVASYDGHDGTDIRVLNASATIDVVAAAAGVVKGIRDGVDDMLVKTETDIAAVKEIECGNGVVIDHGDGWETQYCHLRKGSVVVKPGDKVSVGTTLGIIGYSGQAAFPHVHFSVRKDGNSVDPFSADVSNDCKASDTSLWSAEARKALTYKDTEVLQLAWAPKVYDTAEIEAGAFEKFAPNSWPALVLFAEVINLRKGDAMTVWVFIPGRAPLKNSIVMENNRAVQQLNVGRKLKGPWPPGVYRGAVEVRRGDKEILARQLTFTVP
jgi:hypothetical protein